MTGTPQTIAEFNEFGPKLAVRPYCHTDHYWQVHFDTNKVIADTLGAAGFPVATPPGQGLSGLIPDGPEQANPQSSSRATGEQPWLQGAPRGVAGRLTRTQLVAGGAAQTCS